jgi:CRISPR-associated protein Cas1
MLNYGYSILESECWKAVNTVGLEPYIGFIHKTYTNKAPLVYDLQEPFRWLVELGILKLIRDKSIKKTDFMTTDDGNVRLKPSAVKVVVDRVARQFSTSILYNGKRRQWGSMIMLKTRELTKMF